jgi:hypothetical protein
MKIQEQWIRTIVREEIVKAFEVLEPEAGPPGQTFHGVEIPAEYWDHWNDEDADYVGGFRIGVLTALKIPVNDDRNWRETERLERLAGVPDAADEAGTDHEG